MRTRQEIESAFADRSHLDEFHSFFIVGIGGAGNSVLARWLKQLGFTVRGCDISWSSVLDELVDSGIECFEGDGAEFISPGDAVVLTDAIDLEESSEVAKARNLRCPLFRRSQLLGWLLRDRKVIAVTGSHGKTTTTTMIGCSLLAAGLDPTIVIGADVPQWPGGFRLGKDEWAVVEACEAYDSLRDIDPTHVILTNLDLEHVDFYADEAELHSAIKAFADRRGEGKLFYCPADNGATELASSTSGAVQPYAQYAGVLNVPGEHNRWNAGAAIAIATQLGLDVALVGQGLEAFSGADRRLQQIYDGEVVIIDDYAHHPTEITASIQAMREARPGHRVVGIFQPHLYSRTAAMLDEFAIALSALDELYITDIYPAREAPMPGMSSLLITERIKNIPVHYIPQRQLLARQVAPNLRRGDIALVMGAGNIGELPEQLAAEVERESQRVAGTRKLKVAVVYAGDSAEREVSIHSGMAVHQALLSLGYDSSLIDISSTLLSGHDMSKFTGVSRPDVAILCVHGTHAEDGSIQGLFELLHIPYSGSGIQASAVALDKSLTKQVLAQAGIPVPCGILFELDQGGPAPRAIIDGGEVTRDIVSVANHAPEQFTGSFTSPLVVKPNSQGSTVGLTFVQERDKLGAAIQTAFLHDSAVLVEEKIEGIEISVPVMGDRALPVVEILAKGGSYDFAAKYTPGATNEICPARISEEQTRLAQEQALKCHKTLGCRGITRTDMIVQNDRIVVLEVNTLPGMTATSLVPRSAQAAGLTFAQLVDWIVKDAAKT